MAQITHNTIDLSWTASTDNVAVTNYNIYKIVDDSEVFIEAAGLVYEHTVSGLEASTEYIFVVKAEDAQGNESLSSNRATGTTDAAPGTIPVIGVLSLGTQTGTTQVLSWTAATDDVAVTDYIIYRDGLEYVASTGVVLTYDVGTGAEGALAEYTNYAWTIKAKDADSNLSNFSNEVSGYTDDVTNPTAPTAVLVSKTDTTVTIGWSGATDTGGSGIDTYKTYKDTVYVADDATTPYIFTGLTANTEYDFTIKTVDNYSNLSVASNTVTVTTAVEADTENPVIGTTSLGATGINSQRINWTAATDNIAVTGYRVQRSYNGTTSWITAGTTDGATLTLVVSGLFEGTEYYWRVRAQDAADNFSNESNTPNATTTALTAVSLDYDSENAQSSCNGEQGFYEIDGSVLGNSDTIYSDRVGTVAPAGFYEAGGSIYWFNGTTTITYSAECGGA